MKNINVVQAIIIGVSVVAIAIAVVMFSMFRGGSSSSKVGTVVIWGTIPQNNFQGALQNLQNQGEEVGHINYVQKEEDAIEDELLKAMAAGKGPDLVVLNEKQIIANEPRLQLIPYKSFPIREYQELFIEESNLLLNKNGIIAFPFLVDPLVLYYNKDLLNNAGYSKPPQTWTEVLAITPTLTQKDSSFNIAQSAIALGSFDNINNAKDIYWMLVLQAGNPVIERGQGQQAGVEVYKSIFTENLNFTLNPAYAATNFFTQFSNPTKTVYSWNRSLPDSQTAFVAGDLVFYVGKASELNTIKRLNPNLNFNVTLIPQSQSSVRKATYGSMYVLAIPRTVPNLSGATATLGFLTSENVQKEFAKQLGVASVRKDILAVSDASDPYQEVFNKSAIIAQGILEPDSQKTNAIIKELIDTIVSGQYEVSEAIQNANQKISLLLNEEE